MVNVPFVMMNESIQYANVSRTKTNISLFIKTCYNITTLFTKIKVRVCLTAIIVNFA